MGNPYISPIYPYNTWVFMGYYPQESLYKPYKYHGYTVTGTVVSHTAIFVDDNMVATIQDCPSLSGEAFLICCLWVWYFAEPSVAIGCDAQTKAPMVHCG